MNDFILLVCFYVVPFFSLLCIMATIAEVKQKRKDKHTQVTAKKGVAFDQDRPGKYFNKIA